MRGFRISTNSSEPDALDTALALLKEESCIVVQWSYDAAKETPPGNWRFVEFYASWDAADRVSGKLSGGWHMGNDFVIPDEQDNNSKLGNMSAEPGFTDHRVKQPAITEAMNYYLLSAARGRSSISFNQAAAVMLKEPHVRLTDWQDNTWNEGNQVTGAFTFAAASDGHAVAVAEKLPGWEMTRHGKVRPGLPRKKTIA